MKLQTVLKYSHQQPYTLRRAHQTALGNQSITLTYIYRGSRTQKNRSFSRRVPNTYARSVGLLPSVSPLKWKASPFPCETWQIRQQPDPGTASSQRATERASPGSAPS